MICKKFVLVVYVLAIVVWPCWSFSGDEKIGQWGVELPLPKEYNGNVRTYDIFYDPSGDVLIPYYYKIDGLYNFRVFNFMSGESVYQCIINSSSNKCDSEYIKKSHLSKVEKVDFGKFISTGVYVSDGVRIRSIDGGNCATPISSGFELIFDNGKSIKKKVIQISKEAHEFRTSPWCDLSGGKSMHRIRSESEYLNFYKLNDGTLLAKSFEGPVVIRFTGALSTEYFNENKKYIIADGDEVDEMYSSCLRGIVSDDEVSTIEVADICFTDKLLSRFLKIEGN